VKKTNLKEEKPVGEKVFDLTNSNFVEVSVKVNVASCSKSCKSTYVRKLVIQDQDSAEYIKDIFVARPQKSFRQSKVQRRNCKVKDSKIDRKKSERETFKQRSKENSYTHDKQKLHSSTKNENKCILSSFVKDAVVKKSKWIVKEPGVGLSSWKKGMFQEIPVATRVFTPEKYSVESQLDVEWIKPADVNGNSIYHDSAKGNQESGLVTSLKDVLAETGGDEIAFAEEELVNTLNGFIENEYDGSLEVSWDQNVVKLFED